MDKKYKFNTIIREAHKNEYYILLNTKTSNTIYLDQLGYDILSFIRNNITISYKNIIRYATKKDIEQQSIDELIVFLKDNNFIEEI